MTYWVDFWEGNYYVRPGENDLPLTGQIGPYRFEFDARRAAEKLNKDNDNDR